MIIYYEDTLNSPVETELYWLSSKYYSPELCRFISPDSIDYLDPSSINGLNLYAFCMNDPINYVDPTGHFVQLTLFGPAAFMLLFGIPSMLYNLYCQKTGDWSKYYKMPWEAFVDYLGGVKRKMKKKWFILINLFIFVISLSACTKYYRYDLEDIVDSVEQVYIVEVERTEYYGDISIDYLMEIEEDFDDFLNEVKSLEFESSLFLSPQNNTGINIMLVCNSEKYDYVIIGLRGIEEFKSDKQIYLHNAMCNEEDFNEIINKYYK